MFHPFFSDLNSRDNPQEGLFWHNPNFTPNPDTYRYYAIVDGVRSFILPQLCESEGRTDSLYKGELKNQMDTNAPYLTQLTVSDRETADFTRLLFTQAEKIWFGCWDINPAIFVRTKRNFDEVHYHLRKFTHLYQEETDKWYFFRFYDPRVLVPYLNYIANDPARLASFFGVKEGESIIESFAARIENRFYIFSLENLPETILPVAVTYDDYLKSCFEEIEKEQFLNKLLKIITTEFPERKILAPDIEKYFHNTLELGFKLEGSIINLVKSLCYLSGDMMKLKNYQYELKKEYGSDLSEAEIGELLYEKARLSTQH
ncbi:hypothetical protein BKL49_09170 [Rodentibacter myodis]|uniref:DUF4123 domain-containing protein n=1 Tax=Rodentibacter myodis TaxID=1907939 RepID=A0A1V3JKL7_9PAST|nr:hypothetical protein BKL49_09170 [Rodentibacter myodis]